MVFTAAGHHRLRSLMLRSQSWRRVFTQLGSAGAYPEIDGAGCQTDSAREIFCNHAHSAVSSNRNTTVQLARMSAIAKDGAEHIN